MNDSTIYHPRMISVPVSPYCELARWALDLWGIPYVEECHVPVFNVLAASRFGGSNVVPIVDTGEACLLNAREVVDYYEARSPSGQKLYPADDKTRAEAKSLFDYFYDDFGVAVRAWAYAHMLSHRSATIRVWTARAPLWERMATKLFYPAIASLLRKNLGLKQTTIADQEPAIEAALVHVEAHLADGRRFLMGERLTAPDLALAAVSAPILLPAEYGGPLPTLAELPPAMRIAVERWRARPAGQFILRLYQEQRPKRAPDLVAEGKHASGHTFKDKLANFAIRPGVLRPVFALLRRFFPILVLGKNGIVSRYDDVLEVLKRDRDFTISQINAPKIDKIDGPFILGMDASPDYDRESAALHEVVRREDLDWIRGFVAQTALELIAAARPQRRIDVVNGFARVVPLRVVATYFGMPGPNDAVMMRWMRDVFHFIFADLTSAANVEQDALNSSAELRRHMDAQIARRKFHAPKSIKTGGVVARLLAMEDRSSGSAVVAIDQTKADTAESHEIDDVLGRLIALQDPAHPWLDDNAIRRNLGGVIVGAVDTTSKFVTLAIDQLLRRPKEFAEARQAALSRDIEAVRHYAWEAVRFNPHHPLQVRVCSGDVCIAEGQARSKTMPTGSKVYVGTLSAMFDSAVFTNPSEFNATRQVEYLHFGYGMHTCFGKYINGVQIPELVAALLRLPNLRRAAGGAGQILYDGPFPNRLVLEFDA